MHQRKLVFSQLMAYLPLSTFRRCVAAHRGEHKVKDGSNTPITHWIHYGSQ